MKYFVPAGKFVLDSDAAHMNPSAAEYIEQNTATVVPDHNKKNT